MYEEVFKLHASLLQALAQPKRLEIVHLLRGQELCVGEMQRMLDLPQANLSQHLEVLREAGVVTTRREGKRIFYRLAHKNFSQASDLLRQVLIARAGKGPLRQILKKEMTELVPVRRDQVCGMRLSPLTASYAVTFAKQRYYFCAAGCKRKFQKRPAYFLNLKK